MKKPDSEEINPSLSKSITKAVCFNWYSYYH